MCFKHHWESIVIRDGNFDFTGETMHHLNKYQCQNWELKWWEGISGANITVLTSDKKEQHFHIIQLKEVWVRHKQRCKPEPIKIKHGKCGREIVISSWFEHSVLASTKNIYCKLYTRSLLKTTAVRAYYP